MRWVLAALALTVGFHGGCLPTPEHRCAGDQDCGGGVCVEPPGACAFADPECKGGLRFGEGAGALAGSCIGAVEVDAAAIDARPPIDAPPLIDAPTGPDEDHDGVIDVLDNCPHVANPTQADTTEAGIGGPDGVGDACDPEPTKIGNDIILFDGFNGALTDWISTGTPTSPSGHLRLDQNEAVTSSATYPHNVQLVIHAAGAGAFSVSTYTLGAAIAGNGGLFVSQTTGANPRLRLLLGTSSLIDVASMPITGSVGFTADLTTTRSNWTGDLAIEGQDSITVRRVALQTLSNGKVSITNTGARLDVDYIVVIVLTDQ